MAERATGRLTMTVASFGSPKLELELEGNGKEIKGKMVGDQLMVYVEGGQGPRQLPRRKYAPRVKAGMVRKSIGRKDRKSTSWKRGRNI